jgi:hypothetical protein
MVLFVALVFSSLTVLHCGDEPAENGDGSDSDTDSDTDSDSDSDSDGDSDSDSDSDGDDEEDTDGPMEDLSVLEGQTFVLTIEDARDWELPSRDLGLEIGPYVPTFAFTVTGVDGTDIEAVVGAVVDDAQDECSQAKSTSGSVDPDPEFALDATNLIMTVEGPEERAFATISDIVIDGTFSKNGDYFIGNFNAVLDARDVAHLFVELEDQTEEGVCNSIDVSTAGEAPCVECDDGAEWCIILKAKNVEGFVEDVELEEAEDEPGDSCLD